MSAKSRKNQGSPLFLLALLVVIVGGIFIFKSKSSKSPETDNKKTEESTPASPVTTTGRSSGSTTQSASAGPVGRNAVRAYAGPGAGEITLEWQRYFLDGENFNIRYGTKSKEYPFAAQKIGYISTYTVGNLTGGQKYYFAVEGIRAGNVPAGSDGEVSMTAPKSPVAVLGTSGPVGRNLLSAKPGPKKGQVTLSWTRFFPDTEKYHIVYGTTPGKFTYGLLNAVDATPQDNTYSAVISSLNSGQRYYFALEPQRNGTAIYVSSEASAVAP